jgi:hypothetical protein
MMTADECRQKGRQCLEEASRAMESAQQAEWLRLAENWFFMADTRDAFSKKATEGRQ